MSVNFYNRSGMMAGVDPHPYFAVAPGIPTGVPQPAAHLVGVPFHWPLSIWGISSVHSDGEEMLAWGFDTYMVPHFPVPLPPIPPGTLEIPELGIIHLESGSGAYMNVHSVTGESSPLATCLFFCMGLNLNCSLAMDLPTGLVVNLNTVETTPTLGDYLGALIGAAIASGEFYGLDYLFGKMKDLRPICKFIAIHLLRFITNNPWLWWTDGAAPVQRAIQKLVDSVKQSMVEV